MHCFATDGCLWLWRVFSFVYLFVFFYLLLFVVVARFLFVCALLLVVCDSDVFCLFGFVFH